MNKTQIYQEAAKLIYDGNERYSCVAVRKATGKEESSFVNSEALEKISEKTLNKLVHVQYFLDGALGRIQYKDA